MPKKKQEGIQKLIGKQICAVREKDLSIHLGKLISVDSLGWIEVELTNGNVVFYSKQIVGCIGEYTEVN